MFQDDRGGATVLHPCRPPILFQRLFSNADGPPTKTVALMDDLTREAESVDELRRDTQSFRSLLYRQHEYLVARTLLTF